MGGNCAAGPICRSAREKGEREKGRLDAIGGPRVRWKSPAAARHDACRRKSFETRNGHGRVIKQARGGWSEMRSGNAKFRAPSLTDREGKALGPRLDFFPHPIPSHPITGVLCQRITVTHSDGRRLPWPSLKSSNSNKHPTSCCPSPRALKTATMPDLNSLPPSRSPSVRPGSAQAPSANSPLLRSPSQLDRRRSSNFGNWNLNDGPPPSPQHHREFCSAEHSTVPRRVFHHRAHRVLTPVSGAPSLGELHQSMENEQEAQVVSHHTVRIHFIT